MAAFTFNPFAGKAEQAPARGRGPRQSKSKLTKKSSAPGSVSGLPAVALLLSAPVGAATILAALIISGAGVLPEKTPFGFLDDFYPPAVEKKKKEAAAAAAAKAVATKEAAEKAAKAEAEVKAKAEALAKAAAEKEAAEAKVPVGKAKAAAPQAAAPAPPKVAAPTAAAPQAAAPKATAPKAAAPAVAPAKKAKKPAVSGKPFTGPKGRLGLQKEKVPKYEQERIGKPPKPLPVLNEEFAGKKGFTARGEPNSPGAIEAYKAELARAEAKATARANREAIYQAELAKAREKEAAGAAKRLKQEAARKEALEKAAAYRSALEQASQSSYKARMAATASAAL